MVQVQDNYIDLEMLRHICYACHMRVLLYPREDEAPCDSLSVLGEYLPLLALWGVLHSVGVL